MTREEAIRRANELLLRGGYVDRGRGFLEFGSLGQRFFSAELVTGRKGPEQIGDPYWLVQYEELMEEEDGKTFRPTYRGTEMVFVDAATGHAVSFSII